MSRRRSNQPAISLFSFQDIVTSVTAILILLVLILTLELITQKYHEAAADPAATQATMVAAVAELEAVVQKLTVQPMSRPVLPATSLAEQSRDERILRDQISWGAEQLHHAEQIHDAARERLEDSLAALERQQEIAVEQTRDLRDQAEAAAAARREAQRKAAELDAETARMAQEAADLERANAVQRQELEERRRELDDEPNPGSELVYKRPANKARQPWLLEVSDAGFAALRLGTGDVRRFGPGTGASSQFVRWIKDLAAGHDYVLILTRPSGLAAAQAAREALVARKVQFGIDFIGEDQTVHDGSVEGQGNPTNAAGAGP